MSDWDKYHAADKKLTEARRAYWTAQSNMIDAEREYNEVSKEFWRILMDDKEKAP